LGVGPATGGARPASDAPAMTETDPAGIVSPGTSQDASRLPPVPDNVRGPDAKRTTPLQKNLQTGELVTRSESADDIARNDAFAKALTESMNTGSDRAVNDYWDKWFPSPEKAKAPATPAPSAGPLEEVPAGGVPTPAAKKPRSRKKDAVEPPAPQAAAVADPAPAPVVEPAPPAPTPAAADNLPAVPAAMTGDSEITGFIKKKGVDAAVKQFGQEAVDADGKLVGKKWVPSAAAPKSIDMTSPASSFETAQKESLEVAKQTQEHANARAAASEAAAKPVEEVSKPADAAAKPAPRTLPANAPPVEQMRNLAEQWGVPHEGLSDLELFDAIDAKATELRKTSGPTTFEAPAKPPVGTKIRHRNKPGDVVEGDNVPGEDGEVFPPIPDHMRDSAGELTTEVTPPPKGDPVLKPGTGRMPASSSSTAGKPKPEGVITSSAGTARVIDGTKEKAPAPPEAPAPSTTHVSNAQEATTVEPAKAWEVDHKLREDAAQYDPTADVTGPLDGVPETSSRGADAVSRARAAQRGDKVPPSKDTKPSKPSKGPSVRSLLPPFAVGGTLVGGAYMMRGQEEQAPSDPMEAFKHWTDLTAGPDGQAQPPANGAVPNGEAQNAVPPEMNFPAASVEAPEPAAAAGPEAINRAANGADEGMGPDEVERLSRVLKSVSAARMYGYGQYGPAY
jgi:hypothetical protein